MTYVYRLSVLAVALATGFVANVCGPGVSAGGLVVMTQWIEPIDEDRPTVWLRYSNSGEKPLIIQLPDTESGMSVFAGLDVKVDGREATYRSYDPAIDDPAYPVVTLNPGDVSELIVDLSVLYKLPGDWQQIEVSPTKAWFVPTVFSTGVTIRRTAER